MKKAAIIYLGLFVLILSASKGPDQASGSAGKSLYDSAKAKDRAGAYITANNLYKQARPLLVSEGNPDLANQCRLAIHRIDKILFEYNTTEAGVRTKFKELWPNLPESRIVWLLSRIDHLNIEGADYYWSGFVNTTVNLDHSLLARVPEAVQGYNKFWDGLSPYVFGPPQNSGSPYRKPITYIGNMNADVPRDKLPGTGTLKIWMALPIITDCQTDVSLVSINPPQYVKHPAIMDGDLGEIYVEVPLEQLIGNLQISYQFKFTHFEQRFTMIDPSNVGVYDKNSELYKKYTASGKNILITPEIAAKAREVAGSEQNPYFIARKIYDYIVHDLTYSTEPHMAVESLGIAESVYVHEHGFGDCGGQSIYFSALLRSLGIPARATGGWQLVPGVGGDHIWAEFYLPNYSWVPVDTSVAQIGLLPLGHTPQQSQTYINYFFASMDPYRWVIQKDADVPHVPVPAEPISSSAYLQEPVMVLETMEGVPELKLDQYFKTTVAPAP